MENNLVLPAHDSRELGALRGTTHQITRAFVELHQYTILQEQQEQYPVACQRAPCTTGCAEWLQHLPCQQLCATQASQRK